ncbi:hypothetical protein GCM10009562_05130 [Nocardioides aquaticus]
MWLLAPLARAALIMAAQRRTTATFSEVAVCVGLYDEVRRDLMHYVLLLVEHICREADEPTLTALVVHPGDGRPGYGTSDQYPDWHIEVYACFDWWVQPLSTALPVSGRAA